LSIIAALAVGLGCASVATAQTNAPAKAPPGENAIVAVINSEVITRGDVDNRRRLFALSTGLPVTGDVLDRLSTQVTRELVDERLRLQESQRRHILVQDKEVAAAIADVEARNNMQKGQLARQLAQQGIQMHTLIDQFRAQIAWGRVLRQEMGERGAPSDADVADQQSQFQSQIGQPEYRVSEIFTPVSNPSHDIEAQKFSDTVIQQLRAGAPFSVVAAQFSQSQTALQGGDLGWIQGPQMDPAVLRVVAEMPTGAISNPIKVPGGYTIVTLRAKREIGKELINQISVRQVWLPFTAQLNPQAPTQQQIDQLQKAREISERVRDCAQMEAANLAVGNVRPSDPGPLVLEQIANPGMHNLLAGLPVGRVSPPLPAPDGIALIMVCSREAKNIGIPSRDEIMDRIVGERIELISRQLLRNLQRQAQIDLRG
jgi:peptidyl-prolyl cis-trans isomerase SurA